MMFEGPIHLTSTQRQIHLRMKHEAFPHRFRMASELGARFCTDERTIHSWYTRPSDSSPGEFSRDRLSFQGGTTSGGRVYNSQPRHSHSFFSITHTLGVPLFISSRTLASYQSLAIFAKRYICCRMKIVALLPLLTSAAREQKHEKRLDSSRSVDRLHTGGLWTLGCKCTM